LIVCSTRQLSANSEASSFRCTSIVVPRCSRSPTPTVKDEPPVASQRAALSSGRYEREVTTTRSATAKTE